MANPLLHSTPDELCDKFQLFLAADLKEKGDPDLPSVCSNYWPPIAALSLCFNHLVLSTFRKCRSEIPQPVSTTQYSILRENPLLLKFMKNERISCLT